MKPFAIKFVLLANNGFMTLTIDKFGRVLIPKLLRQFLNIEPGSEIEISFNEQDKALVLHAVPEEEYESEVVFNEWGLPMIKTKSTLPEDFDTVDFMKQTYQDYLDRKFATS